MIRRLRPRASALAATALAAVLGLGGSLAAPAPAAAAEPDPSDIVLVLDFSASILRDEANRNRFGAAVERIAARVDEISADLVAGDVTVSIVQFATRAANVEGCIDLELLGAPATVARFADCLRAIATAYRRGPTNALTARIGTDTNYVAAMELAARRLPAASLRPALILFTDGRHDVAGVPVSQVQPARDRLFGSRSPFALLPVGMGIAAADRAALSAGLERLRITKDMPACVDGATFDWPQVVFDTADEAGAAVAVALQNATCTFTVAPSPTPSPSPTPAPIVIRVTGIRLTPGDGTIQLAWAAPASPAAQITGYRARCRTGGGEWIEAGSTGLATTATLGGLANGAAYDCEIGAVSAGDHVSWTPAGSVTPVGRPAPPAKPAVEALDRALTISVPAQAGVVERYRYECSADGGATWTASTETDAADPSEQIGGLTNGVSYVCRAFATNDVGTSDASAVSDAVRPCSGVLECNPLALPALGALMALLVGGLLLALFLLYRGRVTGYVIAVVDVVHTANIGHGSVIGFSLELDPATRAVTGIVADRTSKADVRIRHRRNGMFVVRDRLGQHEVAPGDPVVVADSVGVRHTVVLRAFETNAASRVATRR
ncbi:MAG TPA: fibronectin type III domain-containing protein [Candidatus Limnocylindrales bacterium]|nr:fibronectin type III domain-containing protein [Candidatus Limnocylindrales bacterium]